ncbi:MAG: hypothetical protein QM758_00695 [Armatimonas sp.]
MDYRWLYIAQNLQVKENVTKVVALLKRAKAADYNGVVLADYKLGILDRVPDFYFPQLSEVRDAARSLGMGLYPTVCSCGYDDALLAHDPNLAEGLPVRGAIFTVKGTEADIESENLLGGDKWTFRDTSTIEPDGGIRFTNLNGANGRVMRTITLAPYRQLHLSLKIKTDKWEGGELRCTVLGEGNNPRSLCHNNWHVNATQDYTEYHAVFNTLESGKVNVYIGCWGGNKGTYWLKDIDLREVGFLNVVRRAGCPLRVVSESGMPYEEGRDFQPVKDERLGTVPWPGNYEVWHAPPKLKLTPNSRIKDGDKLRVGFYHAVCVYDGQVAASLVDDAVFAIHKDTLGRVQKALNPPGFFLSHDELRVANWSEDCQKRGVPAGKLLAEHAARCAKLAKAANPKADLLFWSDMFDPYHNAKDNYYLVRGTLAGSWEGLPKDALIMNWNSGQAKESLAFFAGRGHRQILAGYYDGAPDSIKGWLATAKSLGGAKVVGTMYTTWRGDYNNLEAFAKAAWG